MTDARLGLVGTGFIARHLAMSIAKTDEFTTSRVLTRRDKDDVAGFPESALTNSIEDLVDNCDVVVESSGDPIWATSVVAAAVEAGVPVVTMNTEFHITTGSYFVGKGLVTEAAGDQPGCLADLHESAVSMGFKPVVYGNMKGFQNIDPTPEDMAYWAERQGISLPMVTSFTDGTKVQAEQVLVANHFGATIAQEGMLGQDVTDLAEGSELLSSAYEAKGQAISDYIISPNLSHGVFLVAQHDEEQTAALAYYKLGDGPYYTLIRNNIFVHLEILNTVRRVLETGKVLLDNSSAPAISLAAVAKRDLARGTRIDNAIGSFDTRGHAVLVENHADHVPIGLIQDATIVEDVPAGAIITDKDLELPESLAVEMWRNGTAFA